MYSETVPYGVYIRQEVSEVFYTESKLKYSHSMAEALLANRFTSSGIIVHITSNFLNTSKPNESHSIVRFRSFSFRTLVYPLTRVGKKNAPVAEMPSQQSKSQFFII